MISGHRAQAAMHAALAASSALFWEPLVYHYLSITTCLTQAFFRNDKSCSKL